MRLYADHSVRRTRQIVADLLALGWLALWAVAGVAVHGLLALVATHFRRVAEVGAGIEESMSEIAGTATDLPVVGARLGLPFQDAASAGQRLRNAGLEGAAVLDSLAVIIGILVASVPALLVLMPWLVLRTRFARRAGETERLAANPAGRDLLALRALVTQPAARLATSAPDPVAAWRAGDLETSRRLATLELARFGLRG